MDIAPLVGHLLLATVFLVAGAAKLTDRSGSRRALIDFGMTRALAGPLGLLLPLAVGLASSPPGAPGGPPSAGSSC
jgi:uncharacterized membrane protein YphA (DoxX/SURF4 family)